MGSDITAYACGHPVDPNDERNLRRTSRCKECVRISLRDNTRRWRGGLKGNHESRKTHCPQGHPYDEENTYVAPSGSRQCKTCRKVRVREDYEKHRDRRVAGIRAYREAHAEEHRERARKWQRDNRERANGISRRKKQVRRQAGTVTKDEWLVLVAWYGGRCLCCGSTEQLTMDHVIPLSKGGKNVIDNVQPLCSLCNSVKATKTIDFRMTA